jgi:hypothetical protein
VWLAGGRARLKAEVARLAPLDPARLPYNTDLLRYLQAERREGRELYLTTGADGSLAERVAVHLGIFAAVLASDGATNLTSGKKLSLLKARFGEFDYIGNSRADLPLLTNARQAMVDSGSAHISRPATAAAHAAKGDPHSPVGQERSPSGAAPAFAQATSRGYWRSHCRLLLLQFHGLG